MFFDEISLLMTTRTILKTSSILEYRSGRGSILEVHWKPKTNTQELKRAHDWSWQNNIPILMGKFGTYNIIDMDSRKN
jgi:hypothetical protein